MTTAHALTHGQSTVSALGSDIAGFVTRARAVWTQYLTYRRTLEQLRMMPARTLLDLGLDRAELAAVARRAVYGR